MTVRVTIRASLVYLNIGSGPRGTVARGMFLESGVHKALQSQCGNLTFIGGGAPPCLFHNGPGSNRGGPFLVWAGSHFRLHRDGTASFGLGSNSSIGFHDAEAE